MGWAACTQSMCQGKGCAMPVLAQGAVAWPGQGMIVSSKSMGPGTLGSVRPDHRNTPSDLFSWFFACRSCIYWLFQNKLHIRRDRPNRPTCSIGRLLGRLTEILSGLLSSYKGPGDFYPENDPLD